MELTIVSGDLNYSNGDFFLGKQMLYSVGGGKSEEVKPEPIALEKVKKEKEAKCPKCGGKFNIKDEKGDK